MVQLLRKTQLPLASEVPARLREAAALAPAVSLRERRPAGFPLLLTADLQLIEPAIGFLHEHAVLRAHTEETVRTYAEILYDWFETLEQNGIDWADVDGADLVAYRNRMLNEVSPHTSRPYSIKTVNHRVRGVLRFYAWAVRSGWLAASPLIARQKDFSTGGVQGFVRQDDPHTIDRKLFVLRQFESLPRPLMPEQGRELLAWLEPPYDLMARWQLSTGLRVGEVIRLYVAHLHRPRRLEINSEESTPRVIDVTRKGRKSGYVIAPPSLLEQTYNYIDVQRRAWLARARRRGHVPNPSELFFNDRGSVVKKNTYQHVMHRASQACGFRTTTHALRATFACTMLARLELLARQGAAINPLMIVKVLMGHSHIETTDRYLRAITIETHVLTDVLESLIAPPAEK